MRIYENQPAGTVTRARDLRRNASAPERRLLRGLRATYPDRKWRHSVPFGPFYADILCFSERLVIEVDGDTHAGREAKDAARTRYMEAEGYRVIRIANNDVMQNLEGVISQISLSLREREGAHAQHGKGEGDAPSLIANPSPSPSQPSAGPLPLPLGEELKVQPSSSNVTATSAFALSRTTPSSTSATSASGMKW